MSKTGRSGQSKRRGAGPETQLLSDPKTPKVVRPSAVSGLEQSAPTNTNQR